MSAPGLTVERVADPAGLDRFIRLPETLQAQDPCFVAPLRIERREALSPRSNPWFRHGEAAFFLASRSGHVVGRISAQHDRLVQAEDGAALGQFGLLAAIDEPAVVAALLVAAEDWVRARGLSRLRGPLSLSINEQAGLLVSGFDTPPMLLMPHDPPHLGRLVEQAGYCKARDLFAYRIDTASALPDSVARIVSRGLPPGLVLRPMRRAALAREIGALIAIFNEAWAGNWGFVPFTPDEVAHLAASLKPLLHERLVWFAERDGEPVAFAVCLPNLNEAIRDLGGKLLPLGWAKLLWRLKVAGVRTARVPLMGVRRDLAAGLVGRVLPLFLVDALRREADALGLRTIELSWVLEDNVAMRRLAETLGAAHYKTYRVYEKALAA